MNNCWKYILLSLCGAVFAFAFSCAFIAGRQLRDGCICEKLEVIITDSLENNFVSADDVRMFLDRGYGQYTGVPIDSVNLLKIEKIVNGRSAVRESHAYMTKDGTLHIEVTQRRPVVRFQKKDGGFYADAQGYIFPLQSSFASHVQVIDGNIPLAANSGYKGEISDPEEREWFRQVMTLVNYMENRKEWRDKIVQIHVNGDGDFVMIPRKGNERFILGQPDFLEDKFKKLKKYYTAIVPEKGSGKYEVVDLRYKGQIVCR
jgi:cell division protein FtsQ